MAIKTIDCVECGASVPYGRLSCPACGALLASVAGARRSSVRASGSVALATDEAPEPIQAADPARAADPAPTAPVIEPLLADEPVDAGPTLWPPIEEPAPKLSPRPYQPLEVEPYVPGGTMPPPPSAYRPPTYSPSPDGPDWSDADDPESAATADAPTAAASDLAGSHATERSILDPARFVEIASWFAIVGAAMAILGFLLPWSRVVIGASGTGGYFDGWGLASPTHVLVVLGLMAVLALEIMRAPVPAWLRTGIPGLVLGSLIVGLIWPYVVGRLGADIGVMVTGLGGVALIIGGVVASWATRHGEVERVV
jgi:hypothetical protein